MATPHKELIKIRGTWGNINPVTKVVPMKTLYNRKKIKKNYKFEE